METRIATPTAAPARPLLRQTLTLGLPEDRGAFTLQVIALADAAGPTRAEVPELAEAGWITHSHGPMTIYLRTLS